MEASKCTMLPFISSSQSFVDEEGVESFHEDATAACDACKTIKTRVFERSLGEVDFFCAIHACRSNKSKMKR